MRHGIICICAVAVLVGANLASGAGDRDVATLSQGAEKPVCGANPLGGVPEYTWWYGCSPTSGGMMVGYWDGRPGFGNLFDGDASVWGGSGASGTKSMVAGTAHIAAGGYQGHPADCIADFMKTVGGGTYSPDIRSGLEAYCEWDHPGTAINESYEATATLLDGPFWGGSFGYNDFKAEIDADRPVLLDVICYHPSLSDWVGHSIVGYGYQDNMFQVKVPAPGSIYYDLTVGGVAVMDTWANGIAGSQWFDWNYNVVDPIIDGNGVEWWPFIDFLGSSWTALADWMISDAVTLDVVPEPTSLALFSLAGLLILRRRRAG